MERIRAWNGGALVLALAALASPSRADFSYQMAFTGSITSVDSVVPGPEGTATQLAPGLVQGTGVFGSISFVTDARGQVISGQLQVSTVGPTDDGFVFTFEPARDRGIFGGSLPLVLRGGDFPSKIKAVPPSLTPTDQIRQFILVENRPGKGYLNIDLEHRTAQGVSDYYVDAKLPRITPEPSSLALLLIGLAVVRRRRRPGPARS